MNSCYVPIQVEIVIAMVKAKRNRKKYPSIAILTPYKAQKKLMEDLVKEKKLDVTVCTINESQGDLYESVIIYYHHHSRK